MKTINTKRVLVGGLLGWIAFSLVSTGIEMGFLMGRYQWAQQSGLFLKESRIPMFEAVWFLILLVASIGCAWTYALVRPSLGPGPKTAATVGLTLGLFMGLPMNAAQAAWSAAGRFMPLMWCVESVVGCVLATLVAGYLYRPPEAASN